ncbi:MAG: hypothetical protein R3B13_12715 [Polyangiaceae bacterium]
MVAIEQKESQGRGDDVVTQWCGVVSPRCRGEVAHGTEVERVVQVAGEGALGERLAALSNAELWTRTLASNARRRRAVALLVAHLAEVERRSLHLREGYSSLYDLCLRGLGMSEGEAHRSISSARAARRFPIVLDLLADGRLHLTGLSLLVSRLTESNHAELLEEACGKTKADIQGVLARWFPKPDLPDRIELLDVGDRCRGSNGIGANPADGSEHCGDVHAGARSASDAQATAPEQFERGGHGGAGSGGCRTREQAMGDPRGTGFHDVVEARSAERFAIRFSASSAFRAKLEHARNLMSHVGRNLETVFERALDLLIAERENKCWGKTDRPRRSAGAKHGAPTRQSKRKVYERDAGQCTYVSPAGVHCTARAFLNFDHIKERATGGGGGPDNGRLLCAAHNQMRARQTFGSAFMDDKITRRRLEKGRATTRAEGAAAGIDAMAAASTGAHASDGAASEGEVAGAHATEGESIGGHASDRRTTKGEVTGHAGGDPPVNICQRRSAEFDGEGDAVRASIRQRRLAGFEGGAAAAGSIRQRRLGEVSAEDIRQRRSGEFNEEGDAVRASIRQRRSQAVSVAGTGQRPPNSKEAQVPSATQRAKLVSALTTMGFKKSACHEAVAQVASCGDILTLDQQIRSALALLVPG